MVLGASWPPFGRGLGQSGASLGLSCALLGRFLGVRNQASLMEWSKMGSKRPSGSILGRFWKDLGGFGEDLEEFWENLGSILEEFWKNWF